MGEVTERVFVRIAIVGLGLIGGSIAFGAKRAWPSTHVIGLDREAVVHEALSRRAIDAAADDLAAVADADLIVLARPCARTPSFSSASPPTCPHQRW